MTAAAQLNRIVQLVAELSHGGEGVTLGHLAARFETSERQIAADVRTLTGLGDHADHDWRLSLGVTQQGDRVTITSLGPWRRPLRLTPDEFLALQVALADDREGQALAARFADLAPAAREPPAVAHEHPAADHRILDAVRRAVAAHHKVEILYAGSRDPAGRRRMIRPYEILARGGRFYCVAWCEEADGWRHFRLDRMLDALVTDQPFDPDDHDTPPTGVFHAPDELETVTVRFSPAIARWLRERYPDGSEADGGAWDVTFDVADPDWLVRHVLYFGPEAVVVAPDGYREVVREAVRG